MPGYRVNSKKATRFRQWATKTLKEYITKGFVLNDDMPKNGRPFGKDYFDELEQELQNKIQGINHQIDMLSDKRNTIIRANRAARTAIGVMNDILTKKALDQNDLELLVHRIRIFDDHIEVELKQDIDTLLRMHEPEETVNFNSGIENILKSRLVQSAVHQKDKVFDVHVISNGDPLYTALISFDLFFISVIKLAQRLGLLHITR